MAHLVPDEISYLFGVINVHWRVLKEKGPMVAYFLFLTPKAQQPLVGQGFLIMESSRSHSGTPHLVGLLWRIDQPDP
jgi:hypothetical protein